MYKNIDDFIKDVVDTIVEAVRIGGDSNAYIVLKDGDIAPRVANIHNYDKIEFNGEGEIIYSIKCMSALDLGYEKEEDFIDADAESHYVDDIKDTLERLFLYYNTNELYDMLTIQESALVWEKDDSTIRRVLQGPKFVEGKDFRKSEKPWLIKKESMERVYGEPNFQ